MQNIIGGLILAALAFLIGAYPASAQDAGRVVSDCGASSLAAGTNSPMQMNTTGVLCVDPSSTPTPAAGAALTYDTNTAKASSNVLKTSAGNLYGLQVATYAVAGYVMLFDATSLPANGAVTPVKCWPIPIYSVLDKDYDPPIRFNTGIVIGFSSDTDGCFDLTASSEAFISGEAK